MSQIIFLIVHFSTREGRLKSLQFKILHHIYPTNILLCKMGIRNSNSCSYCNEIDSLAHFFFECHSLTTFWNFVESLIHLIVGKQITINTNKALFGITTDEIMNRNCLKESNILILLGKLSISKNRYTQNPKQLRLILEHEILLRRKYLKILDEELGNKPTFF